jgi:acyl-CoA dehydrogenase
MGLLGGKLKRMELLSARLGDVLAHLYMASACLWRYAFEKDAWRCCRWRRPLFVYNSMKPATHWRRYTPTFLRRCGVWWARWCLTAVRAWRRFAMFSCWTLAKLLRTNPAVVKRLCPDLATPAAADCAT